MDGRGDGVDLPDLAELAEALRHAPALHRACAVAFALRHRMVRRPLPLRVALATAMAHRGEARGFGSFAAALSRDPAALRAGCDALLPALARGGPDGDGRHAARIDAAALRAMCALLARMGWEHHARAVPDGPGSP